MRINRRLGDTSINQISSPKLLDNYFISEYLEQGIAQFAVEGDYQDWSNYREGSKKRTRLYYHPTQFMAFQALALQSTVFSPSDIENIQNPTSFAEILQQSLANEVQASRNAYRQTWIRRIGLLILLEEAYSPLVREFRDRSPSHNGSLFNEWKGWRVKEFSAHDLLASSGMTIEEVREFYKLLAWFLGFKHDPLELLIVFQQYIKDSKIDRLHQQAARAQEYYKLARMVKRFIYDLTKEIMPEPDELDERTWKDRVYKVKKFNYSKVKHRRKVLNDFLDQQLPQMRIAVEGVTEEIVINAILKARNVKQEHEGLRIFRAGGRNMDKDLKGYLLAQKEEGINVFVIVDRDKEVFIKRCISKGILKKKWVRIWRNDFEYDNFKMKRVIKIVNDALTRKKLQPLKEIDIRNRMKKAAMKKQKSSFMNALEIENRSKNQSELYSIISKKKIAQSLIKERIKEIKIEYEAGEWDAVMPIEKVIKRILTQLMPPRSY